MREHPLACSVMSKFIAFKNQFMYPVGRKLFGRHDILYFIRWLNYMSLIDWMPTLIYTCLSCFEKLIIILSQIFYDHAPYQESRIIIMSWFQEWRLLLILLWAMIKFKKSFIIQTSYYYSQVESSSSFILISFERSRQEIKVYPTTTMVWA